jgi:hypothetical protein
MAGSGKTSVTCLPFVASAAAISDPMKPPPTTTNRRPFSARERSER